MKSQPYSKQMNNQMIADTHLHIDLSKDIESYVKEIESNNYKAISMTNLPVVYEKLTRMIRSDSVRLALGYHPQLVYKYPNQIDKMIKLLKDSTL